MKNLLLFAAALISFTAVFAQTNIDPAVQQKANGLLNEKYKGLTELRWEKNGAVIRADFTSGNKKTTVFFDEKGEWTEITTNELLVSDLPEKVAAVINNKFAGYEAKAITKTEKRDGIIRYSLTLETKENIAAVTTDQFGNILSNMRIARQSVNPSTN
jgi:hypothetical protein